ncbi:DUF6992 family protein [Adhaeribacter aerolatus]|uniref:DUF6992 family protein n=1 Tax=Adhaeribacter aerolatus TaxID=670289 RepID=UPI0011BE3A9B|nr:hypothetical protein [Adhaeribacter aerolatus]
MKELKTRHAVVLAIWAVFILIFGGISMVITTDEQLSSFHAMNSSWGLVNLGVAWFLYAHHNEVFEQPQTLLQQMDHQRHIEKMVLFSIGLDLAFIASGFALQRLGHTPKLSYPAMWKGFGTSVIMQRAFLLGQDTFFYRLHLRNRLKVYPIWQHRTEGR